MMKATWVAIVVYDDSLLWMHVRESHGPDWHELSNPESCISILGQRGDYLSRRERKPHQFVIGVG